MLLHKVVFDLFEQALLGRLIVHRKRVRQLLQQLLLLARELGRDLYINVHVEIAPGVAVEHGDALVAQAELRTALCSLRNLQLVRLFERRNLDFGAERGLRNVHRNGAVQVGLVALEKRMLLHFQDDVKVAGRSAVCPRMSYVLQAHAGAVVDARRNVDLELPLHLSIALAAAIFAGSADDLAYAVARTAGSAHRKKALLVHDFPAAVTSRAGGRTGSGLG